MKPDQFGDITAVSALYRPGPMGMGSHTNYALLKNGLQEITPIHPELEERLSEFLGETYGVFVHQEKLLQQAQMVSGFARGQSEFACWAMGEQEKAARANKAGIFMSCLEA